MGRLCSLFAAVSSSIGLIISSFRRLRGGAELEISSLLRNFDHPLNYDDNDNEDGDEADT